MEELDLRVNRLNQIKELLKESKSLVCSIIEEDPAQTATLVDEEGAKALEAETKVNACEEKLAGFQAAINASNPRSTEAAVPATTEATDAPTTR